MFPWMPSLNIIRMLTTAFLTIENNNHGTLLPWWKFFKKINDNDNKTKLSFVDRRKKYNPQKKNFFPPKSKVRLKNTVLGTEPNNIKK